MSAGNLIAGWSKALRNLLSDAQYGPYAPAPAIRTELEHIGYIFHPPTAMDLTLIHGVCFVHHITTAQGQVVKYAGKDPASLKFREDYDKALLHYRDSALPADPEMDLTK